MSDDEFTARLPTCAACGEIIPPSGGPNSVAMLRLDKKEFIFHPEHAPQGCRPGFITTLHARLMPEGVVAQWEKNLK